jgi:hypothetical protein
MSALTRPFRRRLRRGAAHTDAAQPPAAALAPEPAPFEIAPDDPLLAYFQGVSGAVDIDTLELDSPALRELKANGVKLAVPLVSQGELIGVLNLGPRLSEQDYSSDDRKLLDNLAAQAAPALRVGQRDDVVEVAADLARGPVVGGDLPPGEVGQLARQEVVLDQPRDLELVHEALTRGRLGLLLSHELADAQRGCGLGGEVVEQLAVV